MTNELEKCDRDHEDAVKASAFINSLRGRYIMAKALHYAIQALSAVEGVHREKSDISDMEYLQSTLFNDFPDDIFTESKKISDIFAKQPNIARQIDEAKDLQELKDSESEDD